MRVGEVLTQSTLWKKLLPWLMAICLWVWVVWPAAGDLTVQAVDPGRGEPLAVAVRVASGETIGFKAQNGAEADGTLPQAQDLPHLVLTRGRTLTQGRERTLIVEVTGLEVPPGGVTVILDIETQHGDPDMDAASPPRIEVWREVRSIRNMTGVPETAGTLVLTHEFTTTFLAGTEVIATPTDYFRYDLAVIEGLHADSQPKQIVSRDYAFLMERQQVVPLPPVREAFPGAAPHELIVYYCDMFPFRRDNRDPTSWVAREALPRYIQGELIPAMVEAYRVQSDVWGFPWYEAWTSYRSGRDAERLSVALTDGQTWYHGVAPRHGHAGISINVSRTRAEYAALTDALMSTFHHELFHNHQRNIYLHFGGRPGGDGAASEMELFTEGTAVLASSVGQPDVQFEQSWGMRAYVWQTRSFIGRAGISQGDLNKSYGRMSGYHAATYWRFLYEQCGGMQDGIENPAGGMAVIRHVLKTLYTGDGLDGDAASGLVSIMPAVLDRALAGSSCPFKTYRQSLDAFARAIYALRVTVGRCQSPGLPEGCGFYDPQGLYSDPPHSTIVYTGAGTVYTRERQPDPAGIPSSFGMDFVDVALHPSTDRTSLVVAFHAAPGTASEFTVQVWPLLDAGDGTRLHRSVARPGATVLSTAAGERQLVYRIAAIDTSQTNRIGLLITRSDGEERLDPDGAYTITVGPELKSDSTGNTHP